MKHEIRLINTEELKEYENNPRHNENAVDAVAESIDKLGFRSPIIVDKDYVIIAGHTRLKAAKRLGLDKVPCIVAEDMTEEQIKAYRLADNKTNELAEWDNEKLFAELAELEASFDMSLFGFELDEDDDLMSAINDNDMEETAVHEYKLTFGNKTVIMTEEEYAELLGRFDDYMEENGVSFGFVRWLLND